MSRPHSDQPSPPPRSSVGGTAGLVCSRDPAARRERRCSARTGGAGRAWREREREKGGFAARERRRCRKCIEYPASSPLAHPGVAAAHRPHRVSLILLTALYQVASYRVQLQEGGRLLEEAQRGLREAQMQVWGEGRGGTLYMLWEQRIKRTLPGEGCLFFVDRNIRLCPFSGQPGGSAAGRRGQPLPAPEQRLRCTPKSGNSSHS